MPGRLGFQPWNVVIDRSHFMSVLMYVQLAEGIVLLYNWQEGLPLPGGMVSSQIERKAHYITSPSHNKVDIYITFNRISEI